jgi:hypothetical protein
MQFLSYEYDQRNEHKQSFMRDFLEVFHSTNLTSLSDCMHINLFIITSLSGCRRTIMYVNHVHLKEFLLAEEWK